MFVKNAKGILSLANRILFQGVNTVRYLIVTGMSGAGRGTVMNILEDTGFLCVDNLPVKLIPGFMEIMLHEDNDASGVALGIDIRNLEGLSNLENILDSLEQKGIRYEILFLEAENRVLVKRYKETRRNHPLALEGRVDKAIDAERVELSFIKKRADYIIDTSHMLVRELKHEIERMLLEKDRYDNFFVTILTFGFKKGIPADADLVFDVRFLPNPFYIPELKHLTGNDRAVYDYVMAASQADEFRSKLFDMIEFLIPNYINEGKNQLVIAIGCTGGKHRSVAMGRALLEQMKRLKYTVKLEHRDIEL